MEVYCDKCTRYFTIQHHTKKHPRDIVEVYFKCPHCYYHYTAYVDDNRTRKLKRRIKKETIEERREQLQKQLEQRMTSLKNNLIMFGVADL